MEIREKIMSQSRRLMYKAIAIRKEGYRVVLVKTKSNHKFRKALKEGDSQQTDRLIFNIIEFPITQKCTLKCRKCANLMQYYKSPENIPPEEIYRDISMIMNFVDYCHLISIIGGEPFIADGLSDYVDFIQGYSKRFGYLQITTNGTLIPSDDVLCKLSRWKRNVIVSITDYGETSVNLTKLVGKLNDFKIPYLIRDAVWREQMQLIDGELNEFGYAEKIYRACKCKSCFTVIKGKLFQCEFLAQGEVLQAFPYSDDNHVDLTDPLVTKNVISNYLSQERVPPGCLYCSGGSGDEDIIPKAEQVKAPISYRVYDD